MARLEHPERPIQLAAGACPCPAAPRPLQLPHPPVQVAHVEGGVLGGLGGGGSGLGGGSLSSRHFFGVIFCLFSFFWVGPEQKRQLRLPAPRPFF